MTDPGLTARAGATPAVDYDRAFSQLCHLAALNTTDKIRGAIDNLVLTTLVADSQTAHRGVDTLDTAVFVLFGARLTHDQLQRSVDDLLGTGRITRNTDSSLRPASDEAVRIGARVDSARELESRVKGEWLGEVEGLLPDPSFREPMWAALQKYLALAFRRHGAETAQLLDPGAAVSAPQGTLSGYLDQAILQSGMTTHQSIAREAIDVFFRRSTLARTSYLAQLLDGTFTFFALTLDDATTAYLKDSLSPLTVFLDTNYIFGLLDIHENFFVRASKELVRFIQENHLPFRLYYHEYTYNEIVRTLSAQADRLRSRRWSVAISRAAVQVDALHGLERLYHRANAEAPTDVDAFLSRYENVPLLLRPLGIDIYREGGGAPFTMMEKSLFIADYQDFLERVAPRPRSYPAMDHDASVWLAIRRLRTTGGSVLDSGALFLTNDYWFHRFDKTLGPGATDSRPGAVVLPAQLLQLLRPLVPATDDFDRRFVETFALPEFRTVQSGYSATASKVLSYLATYKDLPTETAVTILKSHALSTRLHGLDEDSPEFRDAVESELIEVNRVLLEEKVQLEQELALVVAERAGPVDALTATERTPQLAPVNEGSVQEDAATVALRDRAERAEGRLAWFVRGAALVLFVLGVGVIYAGPGLIGWSSLDQHAHAAGLRLAASVIWGGCCWAIAGQSGRVALGVSVVGGLLVIAQLL